MTTIRQKKAGAQAPAKRGPKPKPEGEKVVKKTVSLKPGTFQGLADLGEGVLSRGIERMYSSSLAKKLAKT